MIRRLWRAPILSPAGLILRAGLILLVYLAMHWLGCREYTSILCGTSPTGNPADHQASLIGLVYILAYFGALLLTPILLIAAGLLALFNRWFDR